MTGPVLGIDPGISGGVALLTPAGDLLASASTFAEVWRKRPRIGAAHLAETGR